MKCRRLTAEPLNARSCFEKESLKEDHKYGLEIKESGEVEHCVKFGPIYNPFRVCYARSTTKSPCYFDIDMY